VNGLVGGGIAFLVPTRGPERVSVPLVPQKIVPLVKGNDVRQIDLDNVHYTGEQCTVISTDLKTALAEMGLTQSDFARLIDVTTRAVALWMAEERAIPGPAEAYIRLLRLLPPNLRQVELSRLIQKGTSMRDGMFGIAFQGQQGSGMGVIVLDNGRVYGTDTEGVRYDGEYLFNESSGLADVKIKVTFPPYVQAVFGISNPYEWAFDVTTTFDPKQQSGPLAVKTSLGKQITAQFKFLRGLPETA